MKGNTDKAYEELFTTVDFSQDKDEIIYQLLEENSMLRRMLDRSTDGIFIVDGREGSYGNSIYCNPVLYNLLGVQPYEIIGRNVSDYEGQFVSKMATLRTMENKKATTVIQTMVRTNRKAIVTSTPVFDEYGRLLCFFVEVRDLIKYESAMKKKDLEELEEVHHKAPTPENTFIEEQQPVIAADPCMLEVLGLALKLARFDSSILLTGETGVGKEVVAEYIHENSPRRKEPFVTVNCATFSKELIESELFGYESGAFTGAKKSGKSGLFAAADGGTLFLDEINSLPYDMQGKLLRVLETKHIRPVGSNKEIPVDFRLIAATNQDLSQLMEQKLFRQDLFYRVNVFSVEIPPLRKRKGDIRPLLEYFTAKYAKKYNIQFTLSDYDVSKARVHDWPGNVRELRNFAEQLVVIGSAHLLGKGDAGEPEVQIESFSPAAISTGPLKERVDQCEKEIIRETLSRHPYKRDAAKELGIDPAVLSRKIAKYKL